MNASSTDQLYKNRIMITFKRDAGDTTPGVELPLKMLMLGNYGGKNRTPLIKQDTIDINKDNFDQRMAEREIELDFVVPDRISSETEGKQKNLRVRLTNFKNGMNSFSPAEIAKQVEPLREILGMRNLLAQLKGSLGDSQMMSELELITKSDPNGPFADLYKKLTQGSESTEKAD